MKIILATLNENKARELKAILTPLGWEVQSLADIGFSIDIVEDGKTFAENATIKAKTIANLLHQPVIADDSGLEIEALANFPGVASARFMGHATDYRLKNEKLLEMMRGKSNRRAYFVCSIAYAIPNQVTQTFTHRLPGEIVYQPKGSSGFGYDPIFYLAAYQATFAELPSAVKNTISHRAMAIDMLLNYMNNPLK